MTVERALDRGVSVVATRERNVLDRWRGSRRLRECSLRAAGRP
ncbi:hypothetical protein [Halosegnis longus]|nr:hypothetical protein [Salella cibi]